VPERYWLARALGVSRHPETYPNLLAFLDDAHPNVVSMAFYALGQRGDRRAIKEILRRIETSDHWYNQWYAYRALRQLGWKQGTPRNALADVQP
jgi:HEAT repeat protein